MIRYLEDTNSAQSKNCLIFVPIMSKCFHLTLSEVLLNLVIAKWQSAQKYFSHVPVAIVIFLGMPMMSSFSMPMPAMPGLSTGAILQPSTVEATQDNSATEVPTSVPLQAAS